MYKANIRPGIIPIRNNARRNFRQGVGPRVTTQTKHRRYDRHRNPNAQFPEHRIPFKLLSSTTYPSLKTLAIYNTLTPGVDPPPSDDQGRLPREDLRIAFNLAHRIAVASYRRGSRRRARKRWPRSTLPRLSGSPAARTGRATAMDDGPVAGRRPPDGSFSGPSAGSETHQRRSGHRDRGRD